MSVSTGKPEEKVLKKMIELGFFKSREEAVRAAVLKYASDMGFFDRKEIWKEITSFEKRDVSPKQLQDELERLEDET